MSKSYAREPPHRMKSNFPLILTLNLQISTYSEEVRLLQKLAQYIFCKTTMRLHEESSYCNYCSYLNLTKNQLNISKQKLL